MTAVWTEGVCGDGAAILRDGVPVPISEVLATLNSREPSLEAWGSTMAPQGMKRPKYLARTMQDQHLARLNPFALELVAEAHADDKSLFGDETVVAIARAHDDTPVFILISTRQPTKEQFDGWPE